MVSQSYVTRYQSKELLLEEIKTKIYLLHFTDFTDIRNQNVFFFNIADSSLEKSYVLKHVRFQSNMKEIEFFSPKILNF